MEQRQTATDDSSHYIQLVAGPPLATTPGDGDFDRHVGMR